MTDRDDPQPVVATDAALKAIRRLWAAVGSVFFVTRSRLRRPDAGTDPRPDKSADEAVTPESRVSV